MTPLILAFLAAFPAAAEPALLKDVKVEARRVVLKLSKPAAFRAKAEAEPPKLTVTFSDTDLVGDERDVASTRGAARWVSTARAVENGTPAARVVIHLDSPRDYAPVWTEGNLVLEFKGPLPEPAVPAKAEPTATPAAPAPAAAAPAPAAPARPSRAFRVQLGSFPTEKAALELKHEHEDLLGPLEVRKAEVGGKTYYRVSMGPFPDRKTALENVEKAAKQGVKGGVTRD